MCNLTDGFIKPCEGMKNIIDPRKGVDIHHFSNLDTGKRTRDLIVVKLGQHRQKGVALNFCPFQGNPLQEEARAFQENQSKD